MLELREYITEELDLTFVRNSIKQIGKLALKVDESAESCISVLLELMNQKVESWLDGRDIKTTNIVLQESVVVIKNIFRRYPNRYESIIGDLCENLDALDEPEVIF